MAATKSMTIKQVGVIVDNVSNANYSRWLDATEKKYAKRRAAQPNVCARDDLRSFSTGVSMGSMADAKADGLKLNDADQIGTGRRVCYITDREYSVVIRETATDHDVELAVGSFMTEPEAIQDDKDD